MMFSSPETFAALNKLLNLLLNDEDLAFIVALTVAMCMLGAVRRKQREKERNRHRNRKHALNEMEAMNPKHFKQMFRMSREAFKQLVIKMEDIAPPPLLEYHAQNSSGSAITMTTRLAVTLRWLAGGSYIDICFEFGVAPGSFYQEDGILWGTMNILDATFELYFPFDDHDRLAKEARAFSKFSHGHMTECTLAIDGWVCRTRCPTVNEVQFPMSYRNRHDCFGIVVLAGCFANLKFGMFSCVSCGSTNDVMAWDFCAMKAELDKGSLPERYYFIGDEAFVNTNQFLVPYSGTGLRRDKDSFNYHLSSMRQCIERAFSLLTQRWGIFWRPLRCEYRKWTLVCTVAAKLHNFCIDEDEGTQADIERRMDCDATEDDDPNVYLNDFVDENVQRHPSSISRRREITQHLEDCGIFRPRRYNIM